jgi:hypothetical protein
MSERPKRSVWFRLGTSIAVISALLVLGCGVLLAIVFFLDLWAATK